jgi:hypothetical protein
MVIRAAQLAAIRLGPSEVESKSQHRQTRGMWLIALINELLTILQQHHRCLGEARSRADR